MQKMLFHGKNVILILSCEHRLNVAPPHPVTTPLHAGVYATLLSVKFLSFGQDVTSCPRVLPYPVNHSKSCSR